MTQSNISSTWGSEVPFESQRRVMGVKVSQNEEIFWSRKRKGVGSAIRRRRANKGEHKHKGK